MHLPSRAALAPLLVFLVGCGTPAQDHCARDRDCYAYETCDLATSRCLGRPCKLGSATDCGFGAECVTSGSAHVCAPLTCTSAAQCEDGLFCNGAATCNPTSPLADRAGCVAGAAPCAGAGTTCDEAGRRCVPTCAVPDADGDGHARPECGGDDCDDHDANRYPGNVEVCDASDHDEDCDPSTFGVRDADGDGFPDARCCNKEASGTPHCGDDCDDADPTVHPAQPEVCNHRDDNCNGLVDEGVTVTAYLDADRDGFGAATATAAQVCPQDLGSGYSVYANDCDDSNPAIQPGSMQCSGTTDVLLCTSAGKITKTTCGPQQVCVAQPNGTGVCR